MTDWLRYILFLGGLINVFDLTGQSYFLTLPDNPETFNRRIALFSNNDILIADSSDDGVFSISNGKVFLTRIDQCGNVIWSYSYERSTEYLEFKDVVIGNNQVIFAYGSAYRGGQEMLFLLKVSQQGRLLDFKLIQTGTVDHFSYAMDYRNGVILLYGLLLDFETQKEGFISIFDEGLQHKWGKHFAPFESEGDALIDDQGRFICRSGPFHYAFDREGNLQWAKEVLLSSSALPIAGPYQIPGGFIFQAYLNQEVFFYKLDFDGNLLWKSDKIPAGRFRADFSVNSNGNIIAIYKQPIGAENILSRLDLDSDSGEILLHQYFNFSGKLDVEQLYTSLDRKGNLRVLGNKVLLEKYPIDIPYFLFQFPLSDPADVVDCFQWDNLELSTNNNIPLIFSDIDTVYPDTRMMVLNTEGLTQVTDYDFPIGDYCQSIQDPEVVGKDTLLACDQQWSVSLPSPDYLWEDLGTSSDRILDRSGIYRAANRDCRSPTILEFTLAKPDCNCRVFLPNAITANGDNLNDRLELHSDCDIQQVRFIIFNRWGVKVFEGDQAWNGLGINGHFEPGTYIVLVEYLLVDTNGDMHRGDLVQEITLLQ